MAYVTTTRPPVERAVAAIAATADGRRVASVRGEGSVCRIEVWDGFDGRRLRTLTDPNGVVRAIALSRDGERVISFASPGRTILWDVSTGAAIPAADPAAEVRMPLPPELARLECVRSPEGLLLLTSGEGEIRLWDARDGTLVRRTLGGLPAGRVVELAPGACFAVCCSEEHGTALWDLGRGRRLHELARPGSKPPRIRISSDGRFVVVCRRKGVEIRELRSGELLNRLEPVCSPAFPSALDLTLDGKRAVVAASDGWLVAWRLPYGPVEGRFLADSRVTSLTVRGGIVALGTATGTVYVLRAAGWTSFPASVAVVPEGAEMLRGLCVHCGERVAVVRTAGPVIRCDACGVELEWAVAPGWA